MIEKMVRLFGMVTVTATALFAQIEMGGLLNTEFSAGGKNSNFLLNEIPASFKHPHFSIHQMNLFLLSQPDDDVQFTARMQFDTWGSGQLGSPRLTLAQLQWSVDSSLTIVAGRFVSPFGLYSKRQMSNLSPFVSAPLLYGYFINLSDKRGLWSDAGNTGAYLQSDVGLTTLYFGGYVTGVGARWEVMPGLLDAEISLTNASLASQAEYTNLHNYGVVGRIGLNPAIFWQQGISFSYGGLMQHDPAVSPTVNRSDELKKHTQFAIGTDWIFGYSYFELSGEFVRSFWSVPKFDVNQFVVKTGGSLQTFDAENFSWYADLKVEPPFLSGSYAAVRFEQLNFSAYESAPNVKTNWDDDVQRLTLAFGYKVSRNVLWKISLATQSIGGTSGGIYDAARTMIVVTL